MLTFPKAGEWSVALIVPAEDGEKSVHFPPVKVFANAHDAEQAEVPEPPSGISLLKEQPWKIPAGTEPAAKHRVVERVRVAARAAQAGIQRRHRGARFGTTGGAVRPVVAAAGQHTERDRHC